MFVKVCGIRDKQFVDVAVDSGYDAVGIVLYPPSSRYCNPTVARELALYAKDRIRTVAVSINYADVLSVVDVFDFIQVYEPIPVSNLIFASAQEPPSNLDYSYFLYDASTGSGIYHAFPRWLKKYERKLILAGGLNSGNVNTVLREISPFGIDVSSGVEIDGKKDPILMEKFICEVKK